MRVAETTTQAPSVLGKSDPVALAELTHAEW